MILDNGATSNKCVAGSSCVKMLRKSRAAAMRARLHIRAQAYTAQPLDHFCIQCLVYLVPAKRWIFMQFQRQTFSGTGWGDSAFTRVCDALWAHGTDYRVDKNCAAPCTRRALCGRFCHPLPHRIYEATHALKFFLQNEAKFCQTKPKRNSHGTE